MVEEEPIEAVKIKRIGVLSLAGTFAIANIISGFLISIILILLMPLISSSFILPFQMTSLTIIFVVTLGFGLITFISFIIAGLFYNLAALITKGIKLYS